MQLEEILIKIIQELCSAKTLLKTPLRRTTIGKMEQHGI
jgi:hypothetical protein